MKTLLVLTIITTILFLFIILTLLQKVRTLNKKNKYVKQADMWHKLAVTDDLTGIYNRNAFNLYVEKEPKSKETLRYITLFDVDGFKTINDTKGHLVGDSVLKDVAQILSEIFCGPNHRVFRIGGDEFSVLSENICEKEVIEKLIFLKKRLDAKGNISLSKGYSVIGRDINQAFKNADEMLYADKMSKKIRNKPF